MADKAKQTQSFATDYVKSDWDKATFLDNPHADNLMTAVLHLGAEFWALKRRQLITEKLLQGKQVLTPADIDAYDPTPAEKAAWEGQRDEFINRVYSVLTRPTTKVEGAAPQSRVPALQKR